MKYFLWTLVFLTCGVAAFGQAAVESAILSGASAGAATGAKGAGSATAGAFGRIGEIVGKGGAASGKASAPQPVPKASVLTTVPGSKPYVPLPIDASMVTVGLSRKDLFSRCGEPRMRITGIRDSKLVETVWYTTADKDQLKVELEADVVTLVVSSRTARANQ